MNWGAYGFLFKHKFLDSTGFEAVSLFRKKFASFRKHPIAETDDAGVARYWFARWYWLVFRALCVLQFTTGSCDGLSGGAALPLWHQ